MPLGLFFVRVKPWWGFIMLFASLASNSSSSQTWTSVHGEARPSMSLFRGSLSATGVASERKLPSFIAPMVTLGESASSLANFNVPRRLGEFSTTESRRHSCRLLSVVCLRRQKEPEKDDGFMLPHSRFEGRFLPVNEHGTFEAEMEALDRLDAQEQADPGEGMKKEFYFDVLGDVRSGTAGVTAKDTTRPLWSKRAAAAKQRWQDPKYREQVMRKRQETKRKKAEAAAAQRGRGTEDATSANATAIGNRHLETQATQPERRRRRNSGVSYMKRNQNEWMANRLEEGRVDGNQSQLQRRLSKRKSYRDAALRRGGSESSSEIGLAVLLEQLQLSSLREPLLEEGLTVALLSSARPDLLISAGASRPDALRLISAAQEADEEALWAGFQREQQKRRRREYMRRYRQRKKTEAAAAAEQQAAAPTADAVAAEEGEGGSAGDADSGPASPQAPAQVKST